MKWLVVKRIEVAVGAFSLAPHYGLKKATETVYYCDLSKYVKRKFHKNLRYFSDFPKEVFN
jgi:hypothetical protein